MSVGERRKRCLLRPLAAASIRPNHLVLCNFSPYKKPDLNVYQFDILLRLTLNGPDSPAL
jgi:hypothetical protein